MGHSLLINKLNMELCPYKRDVVNPAPPAVYYLIGKILVQFLQHFIALKMLFVDEEISCIILLHGAEGTPGIVFPHTIGRKSEQISEVRYYL